MEIFNILCTNDRSNNSCKMKTLTHNNIAIAIPLNHI